MDRNGSQAVSLSAPDPGFTDPNIFTDTSIITSISARATAGLSQGVANARWNIAKSFMATRCMTSMAVKLLAGTDSAASGHFHGMAFPHAVSIQERRSPHPKTPPGSTVRIGILDLEDYDRESERIILFEAGWPKGLGFGAVLKFISFLYSPIE
jgi:hypothetical protein